MAFRRDRRGLNDHVVSIIRTAVPCTAGAAIGWLAGLGLNGTSAAVIAGMTGLAAAGYHAVVRMLESRWPRFGVLLGVAKQPAYVKDAPDAEH